MKKIILSIALLTSLALADTYAQQARAYGNKPFPGSQIDNRFEEFQINKLDNIVGLTRKQENKIKKIENHYDKLMVRRNVNVKQLQWKKQQDIMDVLTPAQRQRLMAFQNGGKFDRHNRRG